MYARWRWDYLLIISAPEKRIYNTREMLRHEQNIELRIFFCDVPKY